jgi:DNA recombination protein RmuC
MDQYIKDLVAQTTAVGREAGQLAQALKSNTKLQGNWGEAVLNNLLEASGLTEGRDYRVQEQTRDEEGRALIPDVVVNLPGDRAVVIDSKVSLTAFAAYAAAGSEEESARCLREHVLSVRRHVKELSVKNYSKVVKNSIGYVLMFVPNEAAYIAAVNADPRLASDAYAQRIILLNPTNLLMALQLAYNLWQSELQSRSVYEIYRSADRLYRKFAGFAKNFEQVGKGIRQLNEVYEKAEKQLTTGRGNIVEQLEGWKKKGLDPSADIPESLLRSGDESDG